MAEVSAAVSWTTDKKNLRLFAGTGFHEHASEGLSAAFVLEYGAHLLDELVQTGCPAMRCAARLCGFRRGLIECVVRPLAAQWRLGGLSKSRVSRGRIETRRVIAIVRFERRAGVELVPRLATWQDWGLVDEVVVAAEAWNAKGHDARAVDGGAFSDYARRNGAVRDVTLWIQRRWLNGKAKCVVGGQWVRCGDLSLRRKSSRLAT